MALQLKPVDAARGPRWIGDAFRLYLKRPVAFTSLFVVFLVGALVVSMVPLLGGLVQMMSLPLLSLGFMVAGQSALFGGPVGPQQFIEPLRTDPARRRSLLILCALYGISALAILLTADLVSDHAWERVQKLIAQGESAQPEIDALLAEPGVAVAVLMASTLGALLSIPFWHAPALVHWGGQGVGQALFSSTLAVWRSKGAFVAYLLAWTAVMLAFGVVTALVFSLLGMPQLAGMIGVPAGLVFSAVFYLSLLFTFNDSFGGATALGGAKPAP